MCWWRISASFLQVQVQFHQFLKFSDMKIKENKKNSSLDQFPEALTQTGHRIYYLNTTWNKKLGNILRDTIYNGPIEIILS